MPMNTVIQTRRKELGLTQEQVAAHLNVSIPAVSKWESGLTSPDIALLPSLARLLNIDLNTLFCFHKELTKKEIHQICSEIADCFQSKGVASAVQIAQTKLHDYPHSEQLQYFMTIYLDSLLSQSDLPMDERRTCDALILSWYQQLSQSSNSSIQNSADFMLASRYIRSKDHDKAQEVLDRMPDRHDIVNALPDKMLLQVTLDLQCGRSGKAAAVLEDELLHTVQRLLLLLYRLVDSEISCGNLPDARDIANRTAQFTELFGLWDYYASSANLQIALTERDKETSLHLLRHMLKTFLTPWDLSQSSLFRRVSYPSSNANQMPMLSALLDLMEHNPDYFFLSESEEFSSLVAEYREIIESDPSFQS